MRSTSRVGAVLAVLLPALAVLAGSARDAQARMYQWVTPGSGAVQLAGEPPPWYRSGDGGPRVRVFENGNLIDDTAIELPPGQREQLRAAAFTEAEQRQREEALERLERAARQEQRRRDELARLAEERREREQTAAAVAGAPGGEAPVAEGALGEGVLDEATVARLKAIVSEFDRRGGGLSRKP